MCDDGRQYVGTMMNVESQFRVQLRKVDRDEFTAYRWGELEAGEIVERYEEGEGVRPV